MTKKIISYLAKKIFNLAVKYLDKVEKYWLVSKDNLSIFFKHLLFTKMFDVSRFKDKTP